MEAAAPVGIRACKAEAGTTGEADWAAIADTTVAGAGRPDFGSTGVSVSNVSVSNVRATVPVDVCEAGDGGIGDCAGAIDG